MQHLPRCADGATGSAPEAPSLQPLVAALAPSMQLVQAALCWFEEANIHHTAATCPRSTSDLVLDRLEGDRL